MSNNNNNNNVGHNNNNNNNSWSCSSPPTSDPSGCSHCQQSCAARTAKANGGCGGASTVYSSVPPIQVTAKVLFGSVSAISALNAERKKKA